MPGKMPELIQGIFKVWVYPHTFKYISMWLMKWFITTLPSILGNSQIFRRARDPKPDAKQSRTNMSAEDLTTGRHCQRQISLTQDGGGKIYFKNVF